MAKKEISLKQVEAIKHDEATRVNIPTAEFQSVVQKNEQEPIQVAYERRNKDLDPQLVWRGKDQQDWSDLVVQAPPLYIQEKVHPKVLIDDLVNQTKAERKSNETQLDLFADFNGIPEGADKTEFYHHDQNWTNRMILGDSLQVMASLAEREGLRGKVQCIYFDPPYGIKFNSNFQWSTRDKSGTTSDSSEKISREPEQVKAFRDTWKDGINSYLTYLRDRLTVARDLLSDSGSIFIQIGDENVHRFRALLDEVFGEDNFISTIAYAKTTGFSGDFLSNVADYIIWYSKKKTQMKYRDLYTIKQAGEAGATKYKPASLIQALKNTSHDPSLLATSDQLTSQGEASSEQLFPFIGKEWAAPKGLHWKTTTEGLIRLGKAERVMQEGSSLRYARFLEDFAANPQTNLWLDIGGIQSRSDPKIYVVQTAIEAIKRCVLMTTDPGDLVLDPTCGSGTTAMATEQWGRRWITIDTSRVALALARARIMGARYPYYLLADTKEGQQKEVEITRSIRSSQPTQGNIKHGFVYERVPHITLKSIANNAEIDVIWEKWQTKLEPLRETLNKTISRNWEEWEIPREAKESWPEEAKKLHIEWWKARIARQKEIDASIAAKAEYEYLYDKPYEDKKKVRVAGPFTVESLSPHRILGVDENDELIDGLKESKTEYGNKKSFPEMILENLKMAGVQQAHKEDKIDFISLQPWPGDLIAGEGRYLEGDAEKRAAIFIGPEFGTVQRIDLVTAAREAADAGFDVLIACAFNFEAHTTEFNKLGKVPVLKARMNADLHMAEDLKNTGKGNLFVIFGEPDIDLLDEKGEKLNLPVQDPNAKICVKIHGVDVFHPNTGEVRSDGADGIACWFIDTDYNEESFFVRHAYFLGANDPYSSLKTTLKAEINQDAWESLHSDTSRPFPKPKSGRIAVKVINHLGDEVMKVFKV
jgi:adenine-specific DNA-methyltransferase